jgi:hypothetical protein
MFVRGLRYLKVFINLTLFILIIIIIIIIMITCTLTDVAIPADGNVVQKKRRRS